jgi:WD40 repeat protein
MPKPPTKIRQRGPSPDEVKECLLLFAEQYDCRFWHLPSNQILGPPIPESANNWMIGRTSTIVDVSPTGAHILFTAENQARLWDVSAKQWTTRNLQHADLDEAVFVPSGRFAVTLSRNGTMKVWNVSSQLQVGLDLNANDQVTIAFALHPSGELIATAGGPRSHRDAGAIVHLWETETGQLLTALPKCQGVVLDLSFSPDGQYLAYCGDDMKNGGFAKLWELPRPVGGSVSAVQARIRRMTGMDFAEAGSIQP